MTTVTLAPSIGSVAVGVAGGLMLGYGMRRYKAEKDAEKADEGTLKADDEEKKKGVTTMTWVLIVIGILLIISALMGPYLLRQKTVQVY